MDCEDGQWCAQTNREEHTSTQDPQVIPSTRRSHLSTTREVSMGRATGDEGREVDCCHGARVLKREAICPQACGNEKVAKDGKCVRLSAQDELSHYTATVMFLPLARRLSTAASVNAHEISHFSRLSAHWWDEHGEFQYLHKMNPVRMDFLRHKLLESARDDGADPDPARVLAGLNVVDVGCGGGLLSEVCRSTSNALLVLNSSHLESRPTGC